MQCRKSIKANLFFIVTTLLMIGCMGGSASGSETATAYAERSTALAESIGSLESQMEITQQAEQNRAATATNRAEQEAIEEAQTATAIVEAPATQTAAGTATQEAIEIAGATATSEVIQPTLNHIADSPERPSDYSLVFFDTFDDNLHKWPLDQSQYGFGDVHIHDGHLGCSISEQDGFYWHQIPDMDRLDNFYVSVDGQRTGGDASGYYGLVFRHMNYTNFYTFEVDDLAQRYWVHAKYGGDWYFILSGSSNEIKPREINRLSVLGEGGTFTFYVNGHRVDQMKDDRFERGKVGVGINRWESDVLMTWRFDNLVVYAP